MGCKFYKVNDNYIKFSEESEEADCLCTFPHNYQNIDFDEETIRSLALLGAMVVINNNSNSKDVFSYIPNDIPNWIIDKIDNFIYNDNES